MVFKLFKNIRNQKGITLAEVIVVIFLIAIFAAMVIADFPKIQKQFAISRAAYKLAQDFRETQDWGLSGYKTTYSDSVTVPSLGYGIFLSLSTPIDASIPANQQYTIYADTCPPPPVGPNYKYDPPGWNAGAGAYLDPYCVYTGITGSGGAEDDKGGDHIVSTVNIDPDKSGVYIKCIQNIGGYNTSINFSPPNPDITIQNLFVGSDNIVIVLGLLSDNAAIKCVSVNTSGLIEVENCPTLICS